MKSPSCWQRIEDLKWCIYFRSGNKVADRIEKETSTFASFVPKLYYVLPVWLKSCVEDKPDVRH